VTHSTPIRVDRQARDEDFAVAAAHALGTLQQLTSRLLDSVPGLDPSRPIDVANFLGLDLKLAWRMFRLARAADPFEGCRHVPGAAGFRIWLDAVRRHGGTAAAIRESEVAFAGLQEVISRYAGSRRNFEMMIAGLARPGGDDRLDFEQHRQMFLGASYVWGIQARMVFRIDVLAPSQESGKADLATVRGAVDLRRLRPQVSWRIRNAGSIDDRGIHRPLPNRSPIDVRCTKDPATPPLLLDRCTSPLPEFRAHDLGEGQIEFEVVGGGVGRQGEQTVVAAELIRGHEPSHRTDDYHGVHHVFSLRTPAETAVFDLFTHRDLVPKGKEIEMIHNSDLHHSIERDGKPHRACDRLPGANRPEHLGHGLDRAGLRELDWYREMLAEVFDRIGWNPEDFELDRAVLNYPPVPSTIVFEREFPDDDRPVLG